MSGTSWPLRGQLAYGGDYNPEQWSRATWAEDVALMREAGVTMMTIGLWNWAIVEPEPGRYDFTMLDEIVEMLHAAGIAIDLGTPTASPPAWFFAAHPDARVVTADGVPQGFGSRGMAAPTSPQYREAAAGVATALAERYGDHPGVVLWHVHNEYGAPVAEDHSEHAQRAFRAWLQARYVDLAALNEAWGTGFWGQRYGDWDHVRTPAAAPTAMNQAQRLDFARFSDEALRECFRLERDAIRARSDRPVTTNFMANECPATDLFAWGREVDVVANDHYLRAADERGFVGLSLAADLTRSVGGNAPWILMEHSTSAVSWQPRNVAKRAGEMARNSLTHVARGADAVMFFQWRASRVGTEKFHSAMVPHAGPDSRVFREVSALGADLARLGDVQGSRVQPQVAILWDTESHWAQRYDWRPSVDVDPDERMRAFYERLWRDHVSVDFAQPTADLSGYRLVVAPASYLLTADAAANLEAYVRGGGTLLVSYFSAVVDEHDAVHAGGFLAPLRGALGVGVEEFLPMRAGDRGALAWKGLDGSGATELDVTVWQEDLRLHGAQVVARYLDGPGAGGPAITRHEAGAGVGWYVSAHLDVDALGPVLAAAYADAGLAPSALPDDVEVVTRADDDHELTFVLNHRDDDVEIPGFVAGARDVLGDAAVDGTLHLPAGGCAVVRSDRLREGGA